MAAVSPAASVPTPDSAPHPAHPPPEPYRATQALADPAGCKLLDGWAGWSTWVTAGVFLPAGLVGLVAWRWTEHRHAD